MGTAHWHCSLTLIPAHCSLFTVPCSLTLLPAHCSLLTAPCSLLTAYCSLLTANCSLLSAPMSLITAHCSLLHAHCSLFTAPGSLLTAHIALNNSSWSIEWERHVLDDMRIYVGSNPWFHITQLLPGTSCTNLIEHLTSTRPTNVQ